MISQRPNRLDETTLAQCNTFLVLKLVNPRDQNWCQNVMEQMSEQDKKSLKSFANGQAYISGHAVRFPLQVQVRRKQELESDLFGDEDFINEVLSRKDDDRETSITIKGKNKTLIKKIGKKSK